MIGKPSLFERQQFQLNILNEYFDSDFGQKLFCDGILMEIMIGENKGN